MIGRFENLILGHVVNLQWRVGKICCAVLLQTLLLLVVCQLLLVAKLGRFTDLIFLSEAVLALMIAPYLACSGLKKILTPLLSTDLWCLAQLNPRRSWMSVVLGSQLHTFCFLGFATLIFLLLIPLISTITYLKVIQLQLVIAIYIVVAASVGGLWWRVFGHEIYATEVTYLGWILLIGGVFLLGPLDRFIDNLEPVIPPFLHLNPLSAVCHLLEIDVFRTPHLYELTPIPSYRVVYPSWHIVCTWQILIGICCFTLGRRQHM